MEWIVFQEGNETPYSICPCCGERIIKIAKLVSTTAGDKLVVEEICMGRKTTGCR